MKPTRIPTMQDVARSAGVSIGTVSNVLSKARYVRPQTRAQVERAIDELGFRPNRLARALVYRRTNAIGLVLPDIANPFFSELARGAEDVFGDHDYVTLLGNSDNDPVKEQRYLGSFDDRRVDGIIVVIASAGDAAAVRELAERIPTVAVDRTAKGWQGDTVVGDNRWGMSLAVRHLVTLGHHRIGFVNGDSRLSTASERRHGFLRALGEAGLEPAGYSEGAFTFASGLEQGAAMLREHERPTAICAANDLLALGILAAAGELGLRVPQDVSILGYDDIAYARVASPGITTVRQPAREMGAGAARLLLGRLADEQRPAQHLVLRPVLVERESTAPLGGTR